MTFRLYVYLVLMDNLLFSCDAFRDKTKVIDTWRNYLRNYSTQIARTNWGFYAPKVKKFDWFEFLMHLFPLLGLKDRCFMQVRNKASYLLQGAAFKKTGGDGNISAQ